MDTPAPFEIESDPIGALVASNGAARMQLLDADGRMFRRRAVKNFDHMVEWAVAELDGVRVYFDGRDVIVTRKDLRP